MNLNREAWNLLTQDEKTALNLQLGLSKSSWQSGEIMGRSHYKYLEIKYRAEFFLKMFTEHLDLYDRMVTDVKVLNPITLEYLRQCIERRRKPSRIIEDFNEDSKVTTKSRINSLLMEQMALWEKSGDAHEMGLFELVKEFDRWNNFRILPKQIQEPSAYKRRIKNVYKKHLKIISNIHPLSLMKLLKLYETKKKPFLYMPIINDGETQIIRVKQNIQSLEILNEVGLYLFQTIDPAKQYLEAIDEYLSKEERDCTDGLNFWPKYRDLIKLAFNYPQIQQITPTRKYLQMALSKLEYL